MGGAAFRLPRVSPPPPVPASLFGFVILVCNFALFQLVSGFVSQIGGPRPPTPRLLSRTVFRLGDPGL